MFNSSLNTINDYLTFYQILMTSQHFVDLYILLPSRYRRCQTNDILQPIFLNSLSSSVNASFLILASILIKQWETNIILRLNFAITSNSV